MGGNSAGTLLGGRVSYLQPVDGHRTGIEPVLLAAFVPAQPGDIVLEGGTGVGAGLLCLAARVPGIRGIGLEADPRLAALACTNFEANGFASCTARTTRLPELPADALGAAAHAFANPPWHDPAGTPPSDPARRLARQSVPGLLTEWASALAATLVRGGTLSMIVPAALHARTEAALEQAGCGGVALFPLWPRPGAAAKLVLLRGARGSRAPPRVLAGLVLHAETGDFTPETEAILRNGSGLDVR